MGKVVGSVVVVVVSTKMDLLGGVIRVVCEKRADKTAHQDHDVSFEGFLLSLVVVLGLKFSLIQQLIAQLCCSSRTSVVENSGMSVD